MTLKPLENLNQLKREAPDQAEFDGLVKSAQNRLHDAKLDGMSEEGQFSSAYSAAHALSLAAMRWHGYRSDNRYLVFQSLPHTLGIASEKWRVLDACHKQRNRAEYEGHYEVSTQLLNELITITEELLGLINKLDEIK